MEIKEIKITINEIVENKITIVLNKLEVLIDDKLYELTNYETRRIKFDKIKKEVVGHNSISIMNGKEYVLKAKDFFVGENLNILLKEIDRSEKEKENKEKKMEKEVTRVKKSEINSLLKELEKFNKKNYKKCIENLINKSLDEIDIDLFYSLKNKF